MSPNDVLAEIKRRDVHVRAGFSRGQFVLYADGHAHSVHYTDDQADHSIADLLGISAEDAKAARAEYQRLASEAKP